MMQFNKRPTCTMADRNYLAKHLVGLEIDNKEEYGTGKYTGCTKTLIEGYLTVTNCGFIRVSSHSKGTSKRYKTGRATRSSIFFSQANTLLPIPFNGYPFEVTGTERWNCNQTSIILKNENQPSGNDESQRKRKVEDVDCNASIQIRTIRIFTEFGIPDHANLSEVDLKKAKEVMKDKLLDALHTSKNLKYTEIHNCRFPILSAHKHKTIDQCGATTQMDKRVICKIRELAKSGIYDVDSIKSMVTDYVYNTLFAHADQEEMPKPNNKRYFPSTKAIRNHIFLAVGSVKNIPGYSGSRRSKIIDDFSPPSITNIMEIPVKYEASTDGNSRQSSIGFVAVHAGAGFHSNERWPGYKHLCSEVCRKVTELLKKGTSAGEAVTYAVSLLEDSEMTNAGFGSNLTEDGRVECDASVMDTTPHTNPENQCNSYFGSVACVSRIKNPVQAAYKILDQQRSRRKLELGRIAPSFLVSEGAENWSRAHGVEMCLAEDLISESAHKTWQKYHQKLLEKLSSRDPSGDSRWLEESKDEHLGQRLDTVGAVVLDLNGNTSAAVSSGGLILKLPGRVGQAATYGCGCWVEPKRNQLPAVAVTTSGCGEQLISTTIAKKCAENLQKNEQPYQALQDTLVHDFLDSPMLVRDCDKQAGLLGLHYTKEDINSTVEVVWGHTTSSMVIGHMSTNESSPKVVLSRLPEDATAGRSVTVGGSWIKVACPDKSTEDNSSTNKHSPDEVEACSEGNSFTHSNMTEEPSSEQIDLEEAMMENGQESDALKMQDTVDDEISLMFVSPVCDGIPESYCEVFLSEEFNRKIDQDFEVHIQQRWQERMKENPRLFNGQKFRIHSVQCNPQSQTNMNESTKLAKDKLIFNLGLTTYRDYMETNWSKQIDQLQEMGKNNFKNSQAYLGEPLGVAGIVLTDDDKAVFQWRNSWLAESPNMLDVPGGHPEPTDAASFSDEDNKRFVNFDDLRPDDVVREIFHSQVKEVRDELNVPLESIGEPRLLGLVRNKLSAGRPVAYFIMRCHLTSDVILQLYNRGGAETDESTKLQFLPVQDLLQLQSDSPDLWNQMCPNGKAACTLYSILEKRKLT